MRTLVFAAIFTLGFSLPAHAYDKNKCEPILKAEKPQMNACTRKKCDKYAVGGANENSAKHGACMDRCAEERSSEYQACYKSLMSEFSN